MSAKGLIRIRGQYHPFVRHERVATLLYRCTVSHVIFGVSVTSFFLCLFSFLLTNVVGVVRKVTRRAAPRAYLLGAFVLFLFGQISNVYLNILNMESWKWLFEIQEVALLLLIPAFSIFESTTFTHRFRRHLTAGYITVSAFALIFYIYGNFVNIGLWPPAYVVYGTVLSSVVYFVSVVCIICQRSDDASRSHQFRVPGLTTVVLYSCYLISDFLFLPWLEPMSAFQPVLVPFMILSWSIAFISDDLSMLIRNNPRKIDFDAILSRSVLSQREKEVVALLLQGRRYHEIGEELFISKATVKTHVSRVYVKLGVTSKMELMNKLVLSDG
jgi:DNA-binding CsgD family transcriptional regulator